MFSCKIYIAEMRRSHGSMRVKKLWMDPFLTSEYRKTGYVPSVGSKICEDFTIEKIDSSADSILLIINRQKNGKIG